VTLKLFLFTSTVRNSSIHRTYFVHIQESRCEGLKEADERPASPPRGPGSPHEWVLIVAVRIFGPGRAKGVGHLGSALAHRLVTPHGGVGPGLVLRLGVDLRS
jgi:hypothetical protein